MRKIFLITERRADYSRFKPILKLIKKDPLLDYDLVVTGLHLKEENGSIPDSGELRNADESGNVDMEDTINPDDISLEAAANKCSILF